MNFMDNETIKNQLDHRTIRKFEEKPVPEEIVQRLLQVANHTSSSNCMQQYSIIRITDMELRRKITDVTQQEYSFQAPELFVYIVDCYRNAMIAEQKGFRAENWSDMDRFFQGFTDAILASQNTMVAVESLGMGGVFFGSILNDPGRIIEILQLPKYTFPALALGFGYKGQSPQLKPRMKEEYKFFENTYQSSDNYVELLQDYDEEMRNYYDLRDGKRRLDTFTNQIVTRFKNPIEERTLILNVIRDQGFNLNIK